MFAAGSALRLATSTVCFNDTATTEIYTLSLHDALPISSQAALLAARHWSSSAPPSWRAMNVKYSEAPEGYRWEMWHITRSEEHTSELQSRQYIVCRLLLEKKKKNNTKKTLIQS